jgi:phenylalanyl-tRNA synthetase beta chain
MRVPLGILREYCDPGWEASEIAERLSMSGTEVERVDSAGSASKEGFVIGLVTSVALHPDADRLRVCTVDVGTERTIVCGAPNVEQGQFVPVALPGAVLPDGTKLKKAKLRGVASEGMILSESELGLGEASEGIMVLDGDYEAGSPLAEHVPYLAEALELEVTTNRPDCLSVYGVARELHAVSGSPLASPPWEEDAEPSGDSRAEQLAAVEVECPEFCPRFTARAFEDVEVGPSPAWLANALTELGQRPINNVVDITNYVMLICGQPLHAFDLDRIAGSSLTVRLARDGDEVVTLDGESRDVPEGSMVICDSEGPVSIAGVMGGASSEVGAGTTRVLLESATWDGPSILRASRDLSLRSEASARFEKGLDPELAIRAQRFASRLLVEVCGARMAEGTIDIEASPAERQGVELRVSRVASLIGMEIDPDTCAERLTRLGFVVEREGDNLVCLVPPERSGDVRREVDLVEEVARLADLDSSLPATLPSTGKDRVGGLTRTQAQVRRAEDVLRDLGGMEIVSYSFHEPDVASRLRLDAADPLSAPVLIANPLSEDQSAMRTTLAHGLFRAAAANLAHGAERVFLFESGRVYLPGPANIEMGDGAISGRFSGDREAPVVEPHHLGGLVTGGDGRSWRDAPTAPDFYSTKAIVESVGRSLGCPLDFSVFEIGFLRPGRTARVLTPSGEAGWLGELDPRVAESYGLPASSAAFELSCGALLSGASIGEEVFSDYPLEPAAYEDLSIIVSESIPAGEVIETIRDAGGDLVHSVELFDIYRSEEIGEDRKSLALRLTFRAEGRTLTDGEVAERRQQILSAIEESGGRARA